MATAHWIRLRLLCRCKWTRKIQVSYGNVSEQYLLLWKDKKGILWLHKNCVYERHTKTYQEKIEQLVTNHKILVHAQDSCACTTLLCMHNILVPAQESCACTRFWHVLTNCWLSVDSHILTRDPSRMVREGLRSILDPLKNSCFPYEFLKSWVFVLPSIAYCPCYAGVG